MAVSGKISHDTITIESIHPHPRNYRKHSDNQVIQLQKSLAAFGQVRSVVVQDKEDGTYLTVAGHGVIEAAKRSNWQTIKADILPPSWSDHEIEGYLIADNQHSKQAKDDEYILAELLQDQKNVETDFESLGFYAEALEDLLAKITPPTLEELAEKYGDDPKEETFWPVIKVKVPPDLKERFDGVTATKKGDDIQKMEHIVALAEKAQDTSPTDLITIPKKLEQRYKKVLLLFDGKNDAERLENLLVFVEDQL